MVNRQCLKERVGLCNWPRDSIITELVDPPNSRVLIILKLATSKNERFDKSLNHMQPSEINKPFIIGQIRKPPGQRRTQRKKRNMWLEVGFLFVFFFKWRIYIPIIMKIQKGGWRGGSQDRKNTTDRTHKQFLK